VLGYGKVQGLSSYVAGSAAAGGTIPIASADKLIEELPFAWNRLVRMAAVKMLDVGGIIGHAGDFSKRGDELCE